MIKTFENPNKLIASSQQLINLINNSEEIPQLPEKIIPSSKNIDLYKIVLLNNQHYKSEMPEEGLQIPIYISDILKTKKSVER